MIRWISLPLAALVTVPPILAMLAVYREYSGKTLTPAKIIESRLTRAGSRGLGTQYDLYVQYEFRGRLVLNNIHVITNSFRSMKPGRTIDLFVDPDTGRAEDDARLASWFGVLLGFTGAALMVLIGFVAAGKMLR